MRILSASHYFHRPDEHAPLPHLGERVNAVTRERYRRIDRFVQLALLGAGECTRGRTLPVDCGLYLATDTGPIASNVSVMDAIHDTGIMPMPLSFIGTLGSSASFHVAKDLGLSSEALLVARPRGSFAAALRLAAADLEAGVVSQALVGAVEECLVPFRRQQDELRLASTSGLAEGSHWLLVERGSSSEKVVAGPDSEGGTFDGYSHAEAAKVTSFLVRAMSGAAAFSLSVSSGGLSLRTE